MCRPGLGRCRRSSRAPPPIDLWPPVGAQHAAPVLGNQHRCGLSFSFSTPSPNSLCAFSQSLYFPLLESVPYLSAKRVFRRSAASRYRRRSPAVLRISGGTGLGILVCSATATNVTYAVVVCFRSPVIAFSE